MAKRFLIFASAALLLALGLFAWWLVPDDPSFGGRPLSALLDDLENGAPAAHDAAEQALRRAGTNAFPALLDLIGKSGSRFTESLRRNASQPLGIRYVPPTTRRDRGSLAFRTLGADALPALPALVKLLEDGEAPTFAATALAGLGAPAVPALTNALYDSWAPVRASSAFALGTMDPAPEAAVPALIECLGDPDNYVRSMAARSLGFIHSMPQTAVPALTAALKDRSTEVRRSVAIALGAFGSASKAAVPELQRLAEDPDRRVRDAVAEAVKKIESPAAQ